MKIDKLRWEVPLTDTTSAVVTIDPKTYALNLSVTGVTVKTHQGCELGLALLEASKYAGQARADRGLPYPPRVVLRRAGYDPSLPRDHPNNLDPTLEVVDDREVPVDEPSPNHESVANCGVCLDGAAPCPVIDPPGQTQWTCLACGRIVGADPQHPKYIVQRAPVAKGDKIEVLHTGRWRDAVVEFVKGGAIRYSLADERGDFMEFVSSSDEDKTWRKPS